MNDNQMQRVAREEQYLDNLFKEADPGYNRFPENLFVSMFLDYFNGTKEFTNEIKDQWLDIAGQLTLPVLLINEDNEVVNTVPPLSNPNASKLMSQTSIIGALMDIKVAQNNNPDLIPLTVQKGIADRITDNSTKEAFKNEWTVFLDKYKSNTKSEQTKQNVDYDFEIDND